MNLINKSRGTGKTTQIIYASAITGFRIIAPNHNMAKNIEKMAKDIGLKIPKPMSDVEYRNKKEKDDHIPILIDELQNEILDEALELYFDAPVVAATMTVPIDDDCVQPTPKPLVWDHSTDKVRLIGTAEVQDALIIKELARDYSADILKRALEYKTKNDPQISPCIRNECPDPATCCGCEDYQR